MEFNSYQVHGLRRREGPVPGGSLRESKGVSMNPDLPHIRYSLGKEMMQWGKTPVGTQS